MHRPAPPNPALHPSVGSSHWPMVVALCRIQDIKPQRVIIDESHSITWPIYPVYFSCLDQNVNSSQDIKPERVISLLMMNVLVTQPKYPGLFLVFGYQAIIITKHHTKFDNVLLVLEVEDLLIAAISLFLTRVK